MKFYVITTGEVEGKMSVLTHLRRDGADTKEWIEIKGREDLLFQLSFTSLSVCLYSDDDEGKARLYKDYVECSHRNPQILKIGLDFQEDVMHNKDFKSDISNCRKNQVLNSMTSGDRALFEGD